MSVQRFALKCSLQIPAKTLSWIFHMFGKGQNKKAVGWSGVCVCVLGGGVVVTKLKSKEIEVWPPWHHTWMINKN